MESELHTSISQCRVEDHWRIERWTTRYKDWKMHYPSLLYRDSWNLISRASHIEIVVTARYWGYCGVSRKSLKSAERRQACGDWEFTPQRARFRFVPAEMRVVDPRPRRPHVSIETIWWKNEEAATSPRLHALLISCELESEAAVRPGQASRAGPKLTERARTRPSAAVHANRCLAATFNYIVYRRLQF